ncbi:MAG: thiamine phosphate synthase [Alphaproteobacteria bacterium]
MIYVLSPPDILPPLRDMAMVCSHPAVTAFQIRLKSATDVTIAQAVGAVQPLCRAHQVALILNDNPVLARRLGCDGVHVGAEDTPVATARAQMPTGAIIGASCYNDIALAVRAKADGASYVAFGALYPSPTKQAKTGATLDLFTQWHQGPADPLPSVAIGGIQLSGAAEILNAGASGVALCSGIWDDVGAALQQMDHLLNQYGDRVWMLTPTT